MKRFLSLLGFFLAAVPAMAKTQQPNIVFIFADDHAAQAISAYNFRGRSLNQTPRIDSLASQGAIFRANYCANSICSPSRASVLTGKHSHINGVVTWERFDGGQFTFPKALHAAGYKTGIFGKWHLSSDPTGFDEWMIHPGQGSYYNPDFITPEGNKKIDGYATDITTDLAIDFMKRRGGKDGPFLLMCHYKAPHRTWQPAVDTLQNYEGVVFEEPATLFDDYSGRASVTKKHIMGIGAHMQMGYDLKYPVEEISEIGRMNPRQKEALIASYAEENAAFAANPPTGKALVRWKYQRYIRDYMRVIDSIDKNVGRILDYLKEAGLEENTIVVYSSDQGFFLGEHGWFDKRWMYEESFIMPLVMRWPGMVKPGTEITQLTQNIDFAPTFLQAAGCEIPEDIQGRSLVPLLKGEEIEWRDGIYYHYYDGPGEHGVAKHYGIRTKSHKLIRYYADNEWEMFDLEKDPEEMNSVHDDPAYAALRKELEAKLDALKKQYGNPIRSVEEEKAFLEARKK